MSYSKRWAVNENTRCSQVLTSLADALRDAPNQSLEDLGRSSALIKEPNPADIPVALSTLVALSDIDKTQWVMFIKEHQFPIEVRPRDATRDVIGKLLKHLEQNLEARKRLTNSVSKERSLKATHASAADFRMTDKAASVLLWSTDAARVGMWASRERKVLEAICLIVVCLYHEELRGTRHTQLKQMLYFAISSSRLNLLKNKLHIVIQKP